MYNPFNIELKIEKALLTLNNNHTEFIIHIMNSYNIF